MRASVRTWRGLGGCTSSRNRAWAPPLLSAHEVMQLLEGKDTRSAATFILETLSTLSLYAFLRLSSLLLLTRPSPLGWKKGEGTENAGLNLRDV